MELLRKLLGIKSEAEKIQLKKEWDEMKHGLKDKIYDLTQPAMHFIKTTNKTNSKLGGKPVVDSPDFVWPKSGENSMTFLAQLDLYDISQQLELEWLSSKGAILFFYDIRVMPWGYDPKDKGKWKVIYQEAPHLEIGYPNDIKNELIIREQYVKPCKIKLLPNFEDPIIQNLNLTDEETDLYIEIEEHYEEFNPYGGLPAHQLGGFPQPIQGNIMEFEAHFASKGVYMGNGKAYKNATEEDFTLAKNSWKLLFQFDSDEEINAMWGDLGRLYFWVEPEKSKLNNFNDTWLILQCT